jgi:crotonobetainyl-CoA:carnitine CoA-transferase CaiB-like acyl-CoA transferase
MAAALAGLRVVEIARGMPGQLAGMVLADFGADVARLESPGGDPNAGEPGARTWTRGKRRIAIDMDNPGEREHALRIAKEADVVLLGVRPTTAERWGLAPAALLEANPRLVVATISGFGWDGPHREKPVTEAYMLAASGLMAYPGNGAQRTGPIFLAPHLPGYSAALLAVQGILAALRERDASGQGQHVDIGLYQAMLVHRAIYMWNPELHPEEFITPSKVLTDPRGMRPMFNLNECSDGRWLSMGGWTPALSYRALEVMGLGHLLADERFTGIPNFFPDEAARKEILETLWARFRERPQQEWLDGMDAQSVPVEPVLSIAEFRDVGQVWANGHAVRVDDPVLGTMVQQGVLGEFSATPGTVRAAEATAGPAPEASSVAASWAKAAAVRGTAGVPREGRGPLAGLRVLDMTMFLSGPMAGHLLADLGAEVLKAEPPEGDDFRMSAPSVFRFLHRDKRSVVVDLKKPEGRGQIAQLVRDADVVLYNYRLGVEERLGLDYAALRAINPDVIVCRITAFGSHGDRAHRGGYDASISALAGMLQLQGGEGNTPVSITLADISTGLAAATAISVAVRARETGGPGQHIDISMIGAMAYLGSESFIDYEGRPAPEVLDGGQRGLGPLYRLYETSDGWVLLSARSDQSAAVLQALGLSSPGPIDAAALEHAFAVRTSGRAIDLLTAAGITCADATVDAREFLYGSPALLAQATAAIVPTERYGRLGQAGPAIRFSRTPVRLERQEPALGEHNDAVFAAPLMAR